MNKQIEGLAILRQAIDYYGCDMQLNVAVEEFAELTKEICKHKRGADNTPQIIEEMSDCYIMLQQIKMMFAVYDGVVDEEINRKIERLGQRMEKEKRQ